MYIQDMVNEAHRNAKEKGFHDMEESILYYMQKSNLFSDNQIKYFEIISKLAKLMLITTEVAEMAEAIRKGDFYNEGEELADIVIRSGDYAGRYGIDLDWKIIEKMEANKGRERLHGKKA